MLNLNRTKSQNLYVSRPTLQLSLPNPLKPGGKSWIRSADKRCSNYILVINNFIAY